MYYMDDFDWVGRTDPSPIFTFCPPITIADARRIMGKESLEERKLRMLRPLRDTCLACSMCELGRQEAEKDGICRDPHVLSNMCPSRFMVVGQNPGWNELEKCEPFVGAAGANFDEEIARNGCSRKDFYITNIVKCWTKGNKKPLARHVEACEPFFRMEVKLLKPKIIVALGSVAFQTLCPGVKFSEALGSITKSNYGNVYAIYHPSPLNLNNPANREMFNDQISLLCRSVKRLNKVN